LFLFHLGWMPETNAFTVSIDSRKDRHMRFRILKLAVACALVSTTAYGQLHVIAGTPTPNNTRRFAMALYRIGQDGAVEPVAELAPKKIGVEWLGMSWEQQRAIILMHDYTSVVLDLGKAAIVKRCSPSWPADTFRNAPFLADVPGRGLTLEWSESSGSQRGVRGIILDPGIPCQSSITLVQPRENRFVVANGMFAIADIRCDSGVGALIDHEGNLGVTDLSDLSTTTPWGLRGPLELLQGHDKFPIPTAVLINDSQMMVLRIGERPPQYFVLRKRDKAWHVIHARTGEWDRLRAFGKFVAIVEARPKRTTTPNAQVRIVPPLKQGLQMDDVRRMVAEENMSPGIEEWRTAIAKKLPEQRSTRCLEFDCSSEFGPDTYVSFQQSEDFFPGRLHLYVIETEKMFTIDTKQGDSEIVLVEDDIVYYRVNDRLYSAPVTETGIGKPTQLAKDEIIRDVHYAFMAR